jgi:drug/metabolite transporter, DME family
VSDAAPGVGSDTLRGYGEAVVAASLWGSSGIFSVYLFRMHVTPQAVALIRPVLGLAMLMAYVAATRPASLRVDRRGFAMLFLAGGAAVGAFQVAYQLSVDAVGVPSTVALLYLAPAIVVALAGPLLGEWPTPMRIGLAVVAVAGVWLSVLGAYEVKTTFGSAGIGWGLAAAASYAAYVLIGRHAAPRWGSMATVVYSTAGACVLLAVLLPFTPVSVTLPRSVGAWGLLGLFGLLTVTVAQFLFFDALRFIDAGRAAVSATAEPLVAALLATILLDQGMRPVGWLGLSLVVVGVAGVGLTLPKTRGPGTHF